MPQIYTAPARITRVTGTGDTSAVRDSNPYSYYDGGTSLTFTFANRTSIDTVFVVCEGATAISAGSLSTSTGHSTYNNRIVFLETGSTSSISSISLTVTDATKIYQVLFMKHLLNLSQSDSRVITSYEVTAGTRNTFIQEDLYGRRTMQSGHISNPKKRIEYQIWQSAPYVIQNPEDPPEQQRSVLGSLSDARNEVNKFYQIVAQNPNITIWDLDEPGARDYESIFGSYWVPDSFSEAIEGQHVINYGFAVEQQ